MNVLYCLFLTPKQKTQKEKFSFGCRIVKDMNCDIPMPNLVFVVTLIGIITDPRQTNIKHNKALI